MTENLKQKIDVNKDEFETIGLKFKNLIEQRDYRQARIYYAMLGKEEQDFISGHPEYRWCMKKLRFSCI